MGLEVMVTRNHSLKSCSALACFCLFVCFIIYMCIQGLGHFYPLPYHPLRTLPLSPHPLNTQQKLFCPYL
jgi:hypothetical protein